MMPVSAHLIIVTYSWQDQYSKTQLTVSEIDISKIVLMLKGSVVGQIDLIHIHDFGGDLRIFKTVSGINAHVTSEL